jgi:ATP-dependent helicase/DNAse subunit B
VARALARGRARQKGTFTRFEGRLGRPVPLPALSGRPISASRLEKIAACAYRAFFADVLHLSAKDDSEGGLPVLDSMTRGSLAHDALRRLARELVDGGRSFQSLPEGEAAARTKAFAQSAAKEWAEGLGQEVAPLLVDLAARELEALVGAVVAFERGRGDPLPVAGAEIRFGPAAEADPDEDPLSSHEPATLAAGAAGWRFQGRIDRVDRQGPLLRVVDYKFGKSRPYSAKRPGVVVAAGERLQLPVYALAARRLEADQVASEYLFVSRDGKGGPTARPYSFTPAETAGAVLSLGRFLETVAALFEAGDLVPRTASVVDGKDACQYCDFRTICGPGHARLFVKKLEAEPPESPCRGTEGLP